VKRPNVVLALADDMGFSDLGCYGGEINTSALDQLGRSGVRMSQFYNTARCSPSRASLLTGLHPHQTGIGVLTNDDRPRGYPGSLNRRCATVAEILKLAGYTTCLAGKWHLTSETRSSNDSWPTRRGFDHFFGILNGAGSYYQPRTLMRQERLVEDEAHDPDFYLTDAITAHAEWFIRQRSDAADESPFFLYLAYTAPHWPLHAFEEDVAPYRNIFLEGWDALRERRMQNLLGDVLPAGSTLSARDPTQPAWSDVDAKEWESRRMAVYAAQVNRLDRGVGRVVAALRESGVLDDTLFLFLSDNGGCAETIPTHPMETFRQNTDLCPPETRDGRPVRIGNQPEIVPGPEDTYSSYGRAWANLSNTPFRFYKRWVHEGGISTPFIVAWPNGGLAAPGVMSSPFQLTDVLPTIIEATHSSYPERIEDSEILPLEGRSMLPALRGDVVEPRQLFWEHIGNAAVRMGPWKLVREADRPWELYDIDSDRAETKDLASDHPDIVRQLSEDWSAWAARVGVVPWDTMRSIYRERGLPDEFAAG
jgi:arylsulfatase